MKSEASQRPTAQRGWSGSLPKRTDSESRPDATGLAELLFCGKLALSDIPVLCELAEMGLLRAPKFLPRWAADRRFLVSYLAYSGFLGRVRIGRVHERYAEVLATAPVARFSRD